MFGAFQPSWLQAREVPLEEVSITLYHKPVTGYRLLMDRPVETVAEKVLEHVAVSTPARPFQFERTIIYENILYRPISKQRAISLYFILRNLEGQLSELTLVAMYDYRRPINTRDFPDLSIRVQADLALLLRRVTGDLLRVGERVFDDQTLQNLSQIAASDARNTPVVEHFQEEEVENEGVLLLGDPFRQASESNPDPGNATAAHGDHPDLKKLQSRVADLEAREKSLLAETHRLRDEQTRLLRKQEQMMEKLASARDLQDSVKTLNQRIEDMLGQYYLADDFSVSNETAAEMQNLQRRMGQLEIEMDGLRAENDSLREVHQELVDAIALSSNGRNRNSQRRQLEQELLALQQANDSLQARLKNSISPGESPGDSLLDLLVRERRKNVDLGRRMVDVQQQKTALETDLYKQKDRNTSLDSRLAELKSENDTLKAAIRKVDPNYGTQIIQDSVIQLKRRIETLQANLARFKSQQDNRTDQDLELQLNAQRIRSLESDLANREKDLKEAQERSRDLQQQLGTAQNQADEARKRVAALTEQQQQAQQANRSLQRDLDNSLGKLKRLQTDNQQLNDSLSTSLQRQRDLNRQVRQREQELTGTQARLDSTSDLLTAQVDRNRLLRNELLELESENDSLRQVKAAPEDQRAFIREQFARLETWETDLKKREGKVGDEEKLLDQKKRFLDQREKSMASQESRLADLEDREEQIRLKEQQLGVGAPVEFSVSDGRLMEFGQQVPVFIVNAQVSYRSAQQRVCAFMLQRDEFLDEHFPDLVFQNAELQEFAGMPVNIRVRIDPKGAGSVLQISFEKNDGTFISPTEDKELAASARQLVGQMVRYKF